MKTCNVIKGALLASALFLASTPVLAVPVSFDGFTWDAQGTAGVVGTDLNLQATPQAPPQMGGSGWANIQTAFDLTGNPGFSAFFEFSITNVFGSGADGLVFTMHNDPRGISAFSLGGGFLGLYDLGNPSNRLSPSVAVEFDTFNNFSAFNDFSDNHVGIATNGDHATLTNANLPFDLNPAGAAHRFAWIDYDGINLSVFVNDVNLKPVTANIMAALDIGSILGNQGYLGFRSSTGAVSSHHRIHSFNFDRFVASPGNPVARSISIARRRTWLAGFRRMAQKAEGRGRGLGWLQHCSVRRPFGAVFRLGVVSALGHSLMTVLYQNGHFLISVFAPELSLCFANWGWLVEESVCECRDGVFDI